MSTSELTAKIPVETTAWKSLKSHFEKIRGTRDVIFDISDNQIFGEPFRQMFYKIVEHGFTDSEHRRTDVVLKAFGD